VDVLRRLGRPPAVAALDGEEAVYVVGGAVRDLLLGREPRELDFVVEGDAVAVARRAAARLGGRVTVHDRFGTATVISSAATFDLAGARRERYERPGALPEVELGAPLRDDLGRRDFTVNAIALHLVDGEIVAWPEALDDLSAGVLRVLHERSFVDDPTRLVRLARYGARLGFSVESGTDALAAAAVGGGAVGTVTPPRLGSELRLLLREPLPDALLGFARHGLGAAVLGAGFQVQPRLVERARELCPPDVRDDLVALALCCRGVRGLDETLDRLEFEAGPRQIVVTAAGTSLRLPEAPDSRLWRLLRRERPETVVVAGVLGGTEAVARRWLDDIRWRRLAIDGNDLVARGLSGPPVGEALDRAMEAMLDGRADGRDEQLAAALGDADERQRRH
jgi:tRNA nucleotidyltransferase (CCA-adding enzyme)